MQIEYLIPGYPLLSYLLVFLGLNLVLYFIRHSVHALIDNIGQLFVQNLRLISKAFKNSAANMAARNREVLLEHGRQQAERELDRQFMRLGHAVENDLARYPTVQRHIEQLVSDMEDKLQKTAEIPAPLPEWTEAVESISRLKDVTKNDAVVGKLLQAIYEAFNKQQTEVTQIYRKDISVRHNILKSAMLTWRNLLHTFTRVGDNWQTLIEQAKHIDTQLTRYEDIKQGSSRAERLLSASNSTQFFIALIVMVIAGFGAFVNYNLIALPMSELMPASSQVAGYNIADIGAAVIIMLELTVGLFFMEAIGITRLFPVIHFMEDKKRMIWAWVCMLFLLSLCFVEAGLAYMREIMVEDKALLSSFLVGGTEAVNQATEQTASMIPMVGQMILGFVLPLILMFVAIPFESFIHSGRHMLAHLIVQLFILFSSILRSGALFIKQLNKSLKNIYDIFCFLPLWIAHLIEQRPSHLPKTESEITLQSDDDTLQLKPALQAIEQEQK